MPFDPIDFFQQRPPDPPDPIEPSDASTIWSPIGLTVGFGVLLFTILFSIPIILAVQLYLGGMIGNG